MQVYCLEIPSTDDIKAETVESFERAEDFYNAKLKKDTSKPNSCQEEKDHSAATIIINSYKVQKQIVVHQIVLPGYFQDTCMANENVPIYSQQV